MRGILHIYIIDGGHGVAGILRTELSTLRSRNLKSAFRSKYAVYIYICVCVYGSYTLSMSTLMYSPTLS